MTWQVCMGICIHVNVYSCTYMYMYGNDNSFWMCMGLSDDHLWTRWCHARSWLSCRTCSRFCNAPVGRCWCAVLIRIKMDWYRWVQWVVSFARTGERCAKREANQRNSSCWVVFLYLIAFFLPVSTIASWREAPVTGSTQKAPGSWKGTIETLV